jgi:hypothetical protein
VEKCIQDRFVDPLKQDTKNMNVIYISVGWMVKSAVAQHGTHWAAWTDLSAAIKLYTKNINRGEGFKLSRAWNPRKRLLRHSKT